LTDWLSPCRKTAGAPLGGYPLHLLFRHTEEVEAGRVFQLVPEVGKEIRKHIAVAIHPQEVVVVLQGVLGL